MTSSSSSSHSVPGSSRSYKYDVFLSFRGEDTRLRFVDHLYTALGDKLIHTFKDDKRLIPGESIGPSLCTAIEESQIALVVFSQNYADSSWCLQELEYIMKCKEKRGLIVIPIFYAVEPTDVRKQTGKFGDAFAIHKNKDTTMVESWRKALADACNNKGFDSKNRHESAFIKEIVDEVLDRLNPLNSNVNEEFVGMTTRVRELKSQLEMESDGVIMVGIWGLGGGGKTTLANSVYMEISPRFQGSCIVENIREKSNKDGLEKLQEKILSAVFKTKVEVQSVVEGKGKISNMLRRRKVLVVLDDVDNLEQLEALAGSHKWFGSGSRIIITTRDAHVLNTHRVDKVCSLILLSDKEAMELFNKHALNEKEPIEDYEGLSSRVVSYAARLPLAVKVLGSFLYDKDDKEWMSTLAKLKENPNMKIVEKLKISYDGLETDEKELFLEIACYFRGWWSSLKDDHSIARVILEACGFHLEIGIKVLTQKALINIGVNGEFQMHDLIQEMAHYIVRRDHPENPEYHSRLWKEEEIRNLRLWDASKKNDKIQSIGYHYIRRNDDDDFSRFCKNVSNMKKLRWIHVDNHHDDGDGDITFLSNELCYINWSGYPGSSFPDGFQPKKLAVLRLRSGLQKELWKGYKDFLLPCLKVLQLTFMRALVSTPNFEQLPCLQELTLAWCYELQEIHPSLGHHTSLEYVDVVGCGNLRKFPTIVKMGKLRSLTIQSCDSVIEIPGIQANMETLVKLSVNGTQIKVVPSWIRECCTNLEELNLKWNGLITRFDSGLLQLTRLKILNLEGCKRLVGLPELPSSVAILKAPCYESLTDSLKNRKSLRQVSISDYSGIRNQANRVLEYMLQGKTIENGTVVFTLEDRGVELARGFTPGLRKGCRCRLELGENWRNEFSGFLFCVVGSDILDYMDMRIAVEQVMDSEDQVEDTPWKESESDRDEWTWVGCVSFASLRESPWWDQTSNHLHFSIKGRLISGFGVGVIPKSSSERGSSDFSQISNNYAPDFNIHHIPEDNRLEISFSSLYFSFSTSLYLR